MVRERWLFVEGGGDRNPHLAGACRRAFSELFIRAGIARKPRVIVCGGRQSAFKQFCQALQDDTADVWLLVDAEEVVQPGPPFAPWAHVLERKGDAWVKPAGARDEQLHLMAVCTETWLLADRDALRRVFGPKLDEGRLPPVGVRLELQPKAQVYRALEEASRHTTAGEYGKGAHCFDVLARVAPERLRVLTWAARLLDSLGG